MSKKSDKVALAMGSCLGTILRWTVLTAVVVVTAYFVWEFLQ